MAAYVILAAFLVADLETQMIKLDESAEQLKEATEVTSSSKDFCRIICFNTKFFWL